MSRRTQSHAAHIFASERSHRHGETCGPGGADQLWPSTQANSGSVADRKEIPSSISASPHALKIALDSRVRGEGAGGSVDHGAGIRAARAAPTATIDERETTRVAQFLAGRCLVEGPVDTHTRTRAGAREAGVCDEDTLRSAGNAGLGNTSKSYPDASVYGRNSARIPL